MPSLWGAKALLKRAPWMQQGRPWQSASKWPCWPTQQGRCEYQEKNHSVTTIIAAGNFCNTNTTCANRRPLEREALARSGKFMPRIYRNKSVEVNNKTCNKQVSTKTQSLWHTCHTSHTQHLLDEQRRRVNWQRQEHHPQTTRQAQAATTTTANTMLFWWDS